MNTAYFTICSRNYLAHALTLRDSLLAAKPGAKFRIFLADEPIEGTPPCEGIIQAADLNLPDYSDMTFRYTVMEFNPAIKPFCFEYLFDREGAEHVVYLDPDILVLRPLEHVTEALANGADAVLTPHITAPPPEDGKTPSDLDLLRSGTYNLGFAAFANRPETRRFIRWWARKCETKCVSDLAQGLFVDQKFAEFVPSFVERTIILRHPGYNAAYWNLTEREITREDNGWHAAGAPLHFFHFSGVVPEDRSVFSKHQERFTINSIGAANLLLQEYLDRLAHNRAAAWSDVSYGYDQFSDGTLIPTEARRVYMRDKASGRTPVPFRADYERLNARSPLVDQDPGIPITAFMEEVWRGRPDLQSAFPLSSTKGRKSFHRWFLSNAEQEHRASVLLRAPARASGVGSGESTLRAIFGCLPRPVQRIMRRLRHWVKNPS